MSEVENLKKIAPVVDLMAALKESLAMMDKKPPQRVERLREESTVHVTGKKAPGKTSGIRGKTVLPGLL